MNAPGRFLPPILFSLAAMVFCRVSIPTYASGGTGGAATTQPAPDTQKKVFTNDDLEAKYGKPSVARETKNSEALSVPIQPTASSPSPRAAGASNTARRENLPPEKDPTWYAQQTVSLSAEIASINNEAKLYIQFRAPGNTPGAGTGLILNAPCEGLSTDNRIAQLLARRQEIEAELADLEDTARRNELPPGLFVQAPAIAAASSQTAPLAPARARADFTEKLGQLSAQMDETQAVVAEMAADTAARRMTLLRPNGYGENFTSDLLQRLAAQTNTLETEIANLSNDALRAGVPARDLP
jgi:hypothetical protein